MRNSNVQSSRIGTGGTGTGTGGTGTGAGGTAAAARKGVAEGRGEPLPYQVTRQLGLA